MILPDHLDAFIRLTEADCWAVMCAVALMGLDVVSGLASALVRHDFKSVKMREGLGHKAMLVIVIALAVAVQGFTSHVGDLGFSVPLIVPACVYISFMEIASVLENVSAAYPDLAGSKLLRLFAAAENVAGEDEGDGDAS